MRPLSGRNIQEAGHVALPGSRSIGAVRQGQIHLGLGAFFRAHGAVYAEDVLPVDNRWGVLGFTQTNRELARILSSQDGLYSVRSQPSEGAPTIRLIGSVQTVKCAKDNPTSVVDAIAQPSIQVVSVTVTEAGYRADVNGRRLDLADENIRHDLVQVEPRTLVGQITRGLQKRAVNDAGPISILSLDNLIDNGRTLEALVLDFLSKLPTTEGDHVRHWIKTNATFPNSVVDRMVPAPSKADHTLSSNMLGLADRACVVAEPFSQWIMEDSFAGERPPWEAAGVTLTSDIGVDQKLKLRILNASHSFLAYIGLLAGYRTIAEAISDDRIYEAVYRFAMDEQVPTISLLASSRGERYVNQVIHRFRNTALGHETMQVAAGGSKKIPIRILEAVKHRLARGQDIAGGSLVIAAWMRALAVGKLNGSSEDTVQDAKADLVRASINSAKSTRAAVEDLLVKKNIFDAELGEPDLLVGRVAEWYSALVDFGALGALALWRTE